VQGGRQLAHWANGLTLSEEIDGALVQLSHHSLALDILAGVKRDSSTDIDDSRPNYTNETHRNFYGGMLSVLVDPRHRPYVYGIVQRDHNPDDVLTVAGVSTVFEYNSHYIGFGSIGSIADNLTYGAEIVYQGGKGLSNSFEPLTGLPVPQTQQDIEALAADLRLEYLFNDENHTRLSGEMILASGDTDRLTTSDTFGGNQSGTKDHAFNAFGLIDTGLTFNPNVSNLLTLRTGISTFPMPNTEWFGRLQVGVNMFVFNKLNRSAPIDEATSSKSYLGFETDVYANWQVTSDVSVALRYGVFLPGDAIAVDHDARHFAFTGVTFAF
ncbi:MAG: alginate export family protein, partial [Pirellulaceae bacterium]|nr:alginate export family protein [Pirellulaceae bacterium]